MQDEHNREPTDAQKGRRFCAGICCHVFTALVGPKFVVHSSNYRRLSGGLNPLTEHAIGHPIQHKIG
jgi:hypothetical protein